MSYPSATASPSAPDLSHAATFWHTEASAALRTNSQPALTEARNTLYSYQEEAAVPAAWQVELTYDPEVNSSGDMNTSGQTVNIGPGLFAHVRVTGGGRTFWIPDLTTLVTADPGRRIIRVRCASEDAAWHWAPRLIRQVMTAQLLAAGMIYTHAAAFVSSGHGVLVAGHRGYGKTTTLLASLHRLGGDYVTNDRLLLHATSHQLCGYPWPMPLRAGIGTLNALPHLADLVPEPHRALPAAEKWTFPHKIVIEPPDFPRLLNTSGKVADRMTPTVMIWPHLDPDRTQVRTELVPPAEIFQTLLCTRMFMTDPERGTSAHINHWLAPGPPAHVTDTYLARTAAALAATPCYRIHAGPDPMALADSVASLLDITALP